MASKAKIMTIINLTPDSFYEPSRANNAEIAVERIREAISLGADIIDLGACSTRPGAQWVSPEEEWNRLYPILECIAAEMPQLPLSIDTFRSSVVEKAYGLLKRHFIVNDISGGEEDPELLPVISALNLSWVAMHKRGDSITMDSLTQYSSVTDSVRCAFEHFAEVASIHNIKEVILDPGFGFAKTIQQNYELVRNFALLRVGNLPLLAGISRKRMTYEPFGIDAFAALPTTSALHLQLLLNGADYLRVHDTAAAVYIRRMSELLERN